MLTSLVGAFYYLRIVKLMYFDDPVDTAPIDAPRRRGALLSANGLALLVLGILPQHLMGLCALARHAVATSDRRPGVALPCACASAFSSPASST